MLIQGSKQANASGAEKQGRGSGRGYRGSLRAPWGSKALTFLPLRCTTLTVRNTKYGGKTMTSYPYPSTTCKIFSPHIYTDLKNDQI